MCMCMYVCVYIYIYTYIHSDISGFDAANRRALRLLFFSDGLLSLLSTNPWTPVGKLLDRIGSIMSKNRRRRLLDSGR